MIDSLKDLDKLLKVLRKQGVTEFEHNGTKLKLGDIPGEALSSEDTAENPYKGFPTGELTPDQLMFYSSGGMPENDPVAKQEAS